jgi:hypothetical protein
LRVKGAIEALTTPRRIGDLREKLKITLNEKKHKNGRHRRTWRGKGQNDHFSLFEKGRA